MQQLVRMRTNSTLLNLFLLPTPQNVEPTGKRFVVAVDVCMSASSMLLGSHLTATTAAAAIAMVRPFFRSSAQANSNSCNRWGAVGGGCI